MDATVAGTGITVGTGSTRDDARAGGRALGALTGAVVALVPGLAFHLADVPFVWLGVPVAALVGAWLASHVRANAPLPIGAIVAMSVLAVVLGAAATGAVTAVVGGDPELIVLGLVFGLYGLVIFGLPALVVTIPCAIAWAWLLRRLVARQR